MLFAIAYLALSWSWAHINVCTESCVWPQIYNSDGCTDIGCRVTWGTKLCVVMPIVCGLLVWN